MIVEKKCFILECDECDDIYCNVLRDSGEGIVSINVAEFGSTLIAQDFLNKNSAVLDDGWKSDGTTLLCKECHETYMKIWNAKHLESNKQVNLNLTNTLMITAKLNLRQLKHAMMTTPKGAKCIVIPIEENNLFEGEKGIYLDIVGFDLKNAEKGKDTHLLKQSLSKEVRAKMSDEELKAMPIIGNARIDSGSGSHGEQEPKGSDAVAASPDDLPF